MQQPKRKRGSHPNLAGSAEFAISLAGPSDLSPYQHYRFSPRDLKRLFDLTVSVMLLAIVVPLMLVVAAAIILDSPGPILAVQARTGRGKRVFRILKFRTMTVVEDGDSVVQCQPADLRVTKLGRFLRWSGLDELPQLLNVILGDMSLVGPRPHATCMDEAYEQQIPGYARRFEVLPGITGLAQVSGFRGPIRHIEDIQGRVMADLEYVQRRSLHLDVSILLRTVPAVLFDGRNAARPSPAWRAQRMLRQSEAPQQTASE